MAPAFFDCFGMGAWVGGLITYQALRHIAEQYNYPLSLFTPGPNKKEIFEALPITRAWRSWLVCSLRNAGSAG